MTNSLNSPTHLLFIFKKIEVQLCLKSEIWVHTTPAWLGREQLIFSAPPFTAFPEVFESQTQKILTQGGAVSPGHHIMSPAQQQFLPEPPELAPREEFLERISQVLCLRFEFILKRFRQIKKPPQLNSLKKVNAQLRACNTEINNKIQLFGGKKADFITRVIPRSFTFKFKVTLGQKFTLIYISEDSRLAGYQ